MVFGGIITAFASVTRVSAQRIVAIVPDDIARNAKIGDSVALNGVCLTVVVQVGAELTFDLSQETLRLTSFGRLTEGVAVQMHVEPALALSDAVGGHVISGHVHSVGFLESLDAASGELVIRLPPTSFPVRPIFKDSIAIDGVSLTVAKLLPERDAIVIALIPHTIKATLFQSLPPGSAVNIELNIATHRDKTHVVDAVKDDAYFMRIAIAEGERGRFTAPPNPWVGAVLVDQWGRVVAKGFHSRPGAPHAEREIKVPMAGCTLYSTLEPCAHHGRTPPCVDYLIEQKPTRVVVGTLDPDERVSGKGVELLRKAGIVVTVGVAEEQVRHSLRAYLWHRSHSNKPYIVCKLAVSLDNCYAYTTDTETHRQWITGEEARKHGHGERAASQRIVVGKNTDAMDKPRLDVRYDYAVDRQPERVVSTRRLEWLKSDANVVQVLVEGGPELEDDLFRRDAVNEFVLYRSTKILGLHGLRWSPTFETSHWKLVETQSFTDGDTMQRFLRVGPEPAPSASPSTASLHGGDGEDIQSGSPMHFDTLEDAIAALRRGDPIVVMDDESRENEGDLMLLADRLTLRTVKTLLAHTTGIVCATMTQARAQQLQLPLMVKPNDNRESHRTKFTLSVDAAFGITTGVSAHDRMETLKLLANPSTKPTDLVRPGHVFPLVAAAGGLLERRGHTEAGVELARMAGGSEHPVMVISELYDKNTGRMMTSEQCRQLGFPIIHIEGLVQRMSKWALWASVPLQPHPGDWQLAVVAGCKVVACGPSITAPSSVGGVRLNVLIRIHSECFTGDVLGSSLCDCGNQLHAALHQIGLSASGGLVVFPPEQEGRGIGLSEKVRAYSLQRNHGLDTFAANERLGHGRDLRNYESVVFALKHLGLLPDTHSFTLLTENPAKLKVLVDAGYTAAIQPLQCDTTEHNARYMTDKRQEFATLTSATTPALVSTAAPATAPVPVAAKVDVQTTLMKEAPHTIQLSPREREYLRNVEVVVVQAEWHRHCSDPLLTTIRSELETHYGITHVRVVPAPGSFEIPRVIQFVASRAAKQTRAANVPVIYVGMGILVKGDTDHYDLVAEETTASIQRLSLDRELWIVNCVLACHTMLQVEERCFAKSPKCVGPHMAQAVARLALLELGDA